VLSGFRLPFRQKILFSGNNHDELLKSGQRTKCTFVFCVRGLGWGWESRKGLELDRGSKQPP
jgi:hypothetical protein